MKSRLACWLLAVVACTATAQTASFSELVVFGDSLSDTGNIATLIGTRPNQVIANNSYVPTFPYRLGRFSDGLVWVDTFAAAFGLSSENSLGGGSNYAFGDARTGGGFPPIPSLRLQADAFIAANHRVVPGDALYVIAGGGNNARDALLSIGADPAATIAATAQGFASDVLGIVDDLQAAGAHHIVVWTTPDVGLAPATLAAGPAASALGTTIAQAMNAALATRLAGEADVQVFDIFGLVNDVVRHPSLYGLVDAGNACGAILGCDPSRFLFWDGIHPTSGGQLIISQAMLGLVEAVPEPSSAVMLIAGAVLLAWVMRRTAHR